MIDERILTNKDFDLLEYVDFFRLDAARRQGRDRKAESGQFFTPSPVARLLVSMLECQSPIITILDAGVGVGSLFAACVAELCKREKRPEQINVTIYEIDERLLAYIHDTL